MNQDQRSERRKSAGMDTGTLADAARLYRLGVLENDREKLLEAERLINEFDQALKGSAERLVSAK